MNEKGSKVLMATIVCLLIVIAGLIAVIFYNFGKNSGRNSNDSNNSGTSSIVDNNVQDDGQEEVSSIIGYYQNIVNYAQNAYYIYEFELKSDNTVIYVIGGSNDPSYSDANVSMRYSGTYIEKDNEVVLSIQSTDSECEDGKYACKNTVNLSKQADGTLVENGVSNHTFAKTDNLLLIK